MNIYKLHFRIGIILGIFLIVMSFTGILLNNAEFLKLDNKFISNEFIYSLYGFEVSQEEIEKEKMKGFSWYRIILDIHNGRILKGFGKYLVDIIGILTIVITITGYTRYSRRVNNNKKSNNENAKN